MARSNKYASLNFNDIYEKRSATATSTSPNSSSSPATANHSKTVISNSRIHGHMLVLSRPTPKPIAIPQPQPGPIQHQAKAKSLSPTPAASLSSPADRAPPEPESDSISLRPQGRTGSSPIISSPSLASPSSAISPLQSPVSKSDRFVPPHLRPGFKRREEKPGGRGSSGPHRSVSFPDPHGEDGRPKSVGGHDTMRTTGGEAKFPDFMNRPGSSG
ncbi:PREDICTED: uncharacterized protein LOC109156034 [Ipomoea nil]|uniref:uncharacterized protein LOC109156034 n=1 Tax=Ipomoea nil TaxID=35883 RepID=UPI000901AABB|nr:PREDICTED: uncharacterized protein LOC109156034 [Ipomoea nil]